MDAKIVCMVDDLSRNALFALLDYPAFTADSSDYLRGQVLARLESGRLTAADVALSKCVVGSAIPKNVALRDTRQGSGRRLVCRVAPGLRVFVLRFRTIDQLLRELWSSTDPKPI